VTQLLAIGERYRRWLEGQEIDLGDVDLRAAELTPEQLGDVLLAYLGPRLERGERLAAESLLARYPRVRDCREAVELLVLMECEWRNRCGEPPVPADYSRRFPEVAHPLRLLRREFEGERGRNSSGQTVPAAARSPAAPQVEGYEILRELGRGGMGVVYMACHLKSMRLVALKMIRAGSLASARDIARFRDEAEAAASLDHLNVCPIYDVNEFQGQQYFSMKYLDGGSLAQRSPGESLAETSRLVATIARAVHHAHQRGILHRDLKPANVLLDRLGTPYVSDFGLAKKVACDSDLTGTGTVVGSPCYLPPEQARGEKSLTVAADVYGLGTILYECLTGRPPFKADTVLRTLEQVKTKEPTPPRYFNGRVPSDLETICLKCLRKEPRDRYQSAAELAEDLERFLGGVPIRARPAGWPERAWKWAKRNPTMTALLGLLLIVAASTVGLVLKWQQADVEQARAENREQRLTETMERLALVFALGGDPGFDQSGLGPIRGRLLTEATRQLEGLLELNPDHPDIRSRIGQVIQRLGVVYLETSFSYRSVPFLQKARDFQRRECQAHPNDRDRCLALATTCIHLARAYRYTESPGEGQPFLTEAEGLLAAASPEVLATTEYRFAVAFAAHLRHFYPEKGATPRTPLERSLKLTAELCREDPENVEYALLHSSTSHQLGFYLLLHKSPPQQAEERFEEARETLDRLPPASQRCLRVRALYGTSHNASYLAYSRLFNDRKDVSDRARAVFHIGRAREIRESLVRENPDASNFKSALAVTLANEGGVKVWDRQWEQALACFQAAREQLEQWKAQNDHSPAQDSNLAGLSIDCARVARKLGDVRLALQALSSFQGLSGVTPEVFKVAAREVEVCLASPHGKGSLIEKELEHAFQLLHDLLMRARGSRPELR
jgi:tetratricopeptide (TPR) repeat protein